MTVNGLRNMRLREREGDKHVSEVGINSSGMGVKPLPFGTRSVKYLILGAKREQFCLKIDHIPGLSLTIGTRIDKNIIGIPIA